MYKKIMKIKANYNAMETKETITNGFKMPGVRYMFAVISFVCLFTNFATRVTLNVAIVAMVNSSAVYTHNGSSSYSDSSCDAVEDFNTYEEKEILWKREGPFIWSPTTQGIILGSFYYGYCTFQVVTGRLAEIYSAKWVFAIGTILSSITSLLIPAAATYGTTALIFARILQGTFQCAVFPSMYSMFGYWWPESEYGILTSIMFTGVNLGLFVSMTATGYLCKSSLFNGWPSAFYIFGLLNCLTVVFWCLLVTNSPTSHPFISEAELRYIVSEQKNKKRAKAPPIPWRKILTSVPFLVLVLTQISQEFSFYIILNDLPTFFATILHFDIEKNGFLSSIPFLLKSITAVVVGYIVDFLIKKQLATINFIRKFCTSFAFAWYCFGLIGVCLAGCNATLSTIFFICSYPAFGFMYHGYSINHIDLSPEYAGTLYGIANSFSSLMGFVAPMFVGFVTNERQGVQEWYIIFGTVIGILIFSGTMFTVFGSTSKQNWVNVEKEYTILKKTPENYNAVNCE